ncbi:MAG: polyhydroxyalkanoate depolymerase [Verrucomicrobia bacterium]|nr:polyhydroxyalkanoate depolymerase [Verrucomicrobiota bacterium]
MKLSRLKQSLALLTLAGAVALGQAAEALEAALAKAGDNRAELNAFVAAAKKTHGDFGQRAAVFLVEGMPEADLRQLDREFLTENLDLAMKARSEFPWCAKLPEELFFNDVLPYASLDETRERWRPGFYEKCRKLVAKASTPTEAVQAINSKLFNLINVHYNTGRKKPNQSPGESIAQSRATCTGLSIILVDACRSVGVAARVAGTPLWSNKRGNHTWTEVWDDGWHFTGSDEYNASGLNRGWFVGAASKADKADWHHAIYATSWKKTGTRFPMVWDIEATQVNAFNVTDRYTGKGSSDNVEDDVFVRVRGGGNRLEVKAELLDEKKQVLASKKTKAGRADLNDIAGFTCNPNTPLWLRLVQGDQVKQIPLRRAKAGEVTLDLQWDDLPDETAIAGSQLAAVTAWLAAPSKVRPDTLPGDWAKGALSKADATKALDLIWEDHRKRLAKERRAEMEAKSIQLGDKKLRFLEKVFGEAPKGGPSLWISMHGGGGAPARVNDGQWKNQIRLYQPKEGIYVAPRAPTDTWNLWHQSHIDGLFDRLIENYVTTRGVNPNRVYLMGNSAGGDGVYQLAPRMADRWAAASMMSGHPNDAKPDNLRNLPFGLFMGGKDGAYNRNKVAEKWKGLLADLRKGEPNGYEHMVRIYPEMGHWMKLKEAESLPWMAKFSRNAWPKKIIWRQAKGITSRFYWLQIPDKHLAKGQRITAEVNGQTIAVIAENTPRLIVRLSDQLVDLDKPVSITVNGEEKFSGSVKRSAQEIIKSLGQRADPASAATASVTLKL